MEMIKRQNLFLLNASALCQGKITRHRATKNGLEQSIIDYVIVCETLYSKLVKMLIDEDRIHTLTKYASTRGVVGKSESDHNQLFCEFDIPYASRVRVDDRQTIFNFKNAEGQEMFHKLTSESEIFAGLRDEKISVEKRSQYHMFCSLQTLVPFRSDLDGDEI